MVSVVVSHLICTMALVTLIIILPVYYTGIQDNIRVDVVKMELKEVTNYISNTFGNTYVLVNSTNTPNANITKRLVYLPSTVEGYLFEIRIEQESTKAIGVTAYLKDRPNVEVTAWLSPGMKVDNVSPLESGKGMVVAGCYRQGQDIFVTLNYEGDHV